MPHIWFATLAPAAAGDGFAGKIELFAAKFNLNWHDFLSAAFCFLVIAYLLNRFLFKPLIRVAEERQREAEQAARNAQEIQRQLDALAAERERTLREAHEMAAKIISDSRTHAAELADEAQRSLYAERAQSLAKFQEELQQLERRIKSELRGDIARLIVLTTAKLAAWNLSADDKERLSAMAVKEIEDEIAGKAAKA